MVVVVQQHPVVEVEDQVAVQAVAVVVLRVEDRHQCNRESYRSHFIGVFLKSTVKNRVFVKLDMRCADYFTEYAQYFGRALKLLKSMYGMTNSGKRFADELTEWLIEEGFIQSQCQMSIYYKYVPDGSKIVF